MMIVNNSYLITEDLLTTVELGSTIFDTEAEKMYIVLEPGNLTEIDMTTLTAETLEELIEAIAAGGNVKITKAIDAPTAFAPAADTTITNDAEITVKEDTVGDGVFTVTAGTLTLNGKGTINGLGNNPYSMAIWIVA